MEDIRSMTIDQIENEAFKDGVRYALQRLEEVFGEEVTETDLWSEYNPTE